jgi:molecular chaperone Hsp33
VTKLFQHNHNPYTSVIDLVDTETKAVVNKILSESYQTNSEVVVGEVSDQAIMVTKLPPVNANAVVDESMARKEYIKRNSHFFHDVFETATDDIEKIVKMFEDHDLAYTTSRQIDFFCPCSKDRMMFNMKALYSGDLEKIFEGKPTVEVKCDYCRKNYVMTPEELKDLKLS